MKVIGVRDVEAAKGKIKLEPGDVVTPLARDRAVELGVTFEKNQRHAKNSGESATFGSGTPVEAIESDNERSQIVYRRAKTGKSAEGPPSGILYRRSAPVVEESRSPGSLSTSDHSVSTRRRNSRVTVVGAGHVGVSTAMRLADSDVFEEVAMLDVVPGLAAGLALDLSHSSSLRKFATRISGSTDHSEAADSGFVVITAGKPRQPGMTRSDLTAANTRIVGSICDDIARYSPNSIVVVVTNPLDEMTELAYQRTGFPSHRVTGMAGVLDSARFCSLAAQLIGERPENISAMALGSHGKEMVIPLSQAKLGNTLITEVLDSNALERLVERVRDSGAEVVGLLKTGSAYHAPAVSVAKMVLAMAQDSNEVLPACVRADGTYGIKDTYVGLPARLNAEGVSEIAKLDLTSAELSELQVAAQRIAERVAQMNISVATGR